MKKTLPYFLISFIFVGSFAFSQNEVLLNNISPETQREVHKRFPNLKKGPLTPSLIDEVLRFIGSQKTYENVRAERNSSGDLSISAETKRLVGSISFQGNQNISTKNLEEVLKIHPGDRFDRKLAVESGENLKQIYGENGYFNTVVEINFDQQSEGNMNVSFKITENEPCRIQNISITSENESLKKRLNNRVKKFLRRNLTQENLDLTLKDIRNFLIDKDYLASSIRDPKIEYNEDKSRATILLDIHEPFTWEFNISGNKQRTLSELYTELNLNDRERHNIDPLAESIDRLRKYYLRQGFPHVAISSRMVKTEFSRRVYLNIVEGPRVKIEAFRIEGRISRPESYYIQLIEEHGSSILDRGFYHREDLDLGLENLITHLKNQGFLKARVQSLRVEFSENKEKATVFINMDEGSLTQIRSISFDGNSFFSERELVSVFGLETRAPLKLNDLESGIEKIKNFYKHQGFLEMRVLNEDETLVSYNTRGTLAEVNFKLYEGPRVRVAEIVIDGNSFTKDYVIRREADLTPGQILNPQSIEEALDRLNRLGIFSRVDIRTLEEDTAISDRTLIISVSEREPGMFRMGAGVNSERDFTTRGFVGLGYNNLGGTGRAISGRAELNYNIAQINYPEYEVSVSYLEPFLFNTKNRGRVNLARSERVFEYLSKDEGLTSLTLSERADFLVERQFDKHVRTTFKLWSIDRRVDFEAKGRCLWDPATGRPDPSKQCPSFTQQIGKIGPTIDFDYRDNPFLPTSGSFARALFEYSDPNLGSSRGIHFMKADTQYSKYIPLAGPRLVWANSIRGGYLKNLDGSPGSGIPANQAFFLGGIFTVRGFDSARGNERIPPESEVPVSRSTAIVVSDYSYYGLFKSELRFPISGEHGGVLFYDGGLVQIEGEINGDPVNISRPYRDSVGLGYRYNTPVGPVALDLAFKIKPRHSRGEDLFRVHFSIGTF